jgi:hypothetical protein
VTENHPSECNLRFKIFKARTIGQNKGDKTMRLGIRHLGCALAVIAASGCSRGSGATHAAETAAAAASSSSANPAIVAAATGAVAGGFRGFDSNDYPGDGTMAMLHKTFAFAGYWLTNPPGETSNSWRGKRALLRQQGWGFLALANGRLDDEILKAQKSGTSPAALAHKDAAAAVVAARSEGFPAHAIVFLDQEEGGILLDEQAAYLLAWTEAVAASDFRPGVYASGQPVPNGPGQTITTIEDIRAHVITGHLHPIAMFDAQDACPPAPGCTVHAEPLSSAGEITLSSGGDLVAWQYSQSPRRPELTRSCASTYAADGNCYAPGVPTVLLDMDLASSADPSHGR